MQTRKLLTLVASACVAFSAIGCMRLQPLHAPTFQVATSDQGKIQESIRQALLDRHWSILARRADGFDAEYKRTPEQGAKIRVTHSGNKVSIEYLDSTDLEYTSLNGTKEIHKRYNGWVKNLERDIQVEIGRRI